MFKSTNFTKKFLLSLTLSSLLTGYTPACQAVNIRTAGGYTCYTLAGILTLSGGLNILDFIVADPEDQNSESAREVVLGTVVCALMISGFYLGGKQLLKS